MDDATKARIHAICIKKGLYRDPSSRVARALVVDALYAYMSGYVSRQFLAGLAEELLFLTSRPHKPMAVHKDFLGALRSMVLLGMLAQGDPALKETHGKLMDFLSHKKFV